jgi:NitT/TauT family transport system ATP-binding protein
MDATGTMPPPQQERQATARLEIRGVEFRYGDFVAATELNASIAPGQFVSLIGPSGCGKSTLLQGIGGLLAPTSGEILLGGRKVTGPRPNEAAYVFQDLALLPWRTARRNVELPLELGSVPRDERRKRAEEALALVGLADAAGKFPHELSGGMRQRVALARAFVSDADVLLLDEPFAALDEQARIVMGLELLRLLSDHRKTVVFVTHSLHEAAFLSDRVLVMSKRPARIIADIAVPLASPREPEMMQSPPFHETYDELFGLLIAQSLQRRPS